MAWTYAQLITEMHTRQNLAQSQLFYARQDYDTAQVRWSAADDHGAIDALMDAVYHNNQAVEDALASSYYGYGGATNIIPTAFDLLSPYVPPEPFDLTMGDILSVMLSAEPSEVEYFVGLVDAYRQSIWNKPFNAEFFAALARGFEEWP